MAKLNGFAIGAIGIGSLMVYAGITGRSLLKAIQTVIQGQAPSKAPKDQPITGIAATDTAPNVTGLNAGAQGLQGLSGVLSHTQLMDLWVANGGSSSTANVAAAVAGAESAGQPRVTSPNPDGGTNVGLWQLDTPGGKGAGYSIAQLQDPNTNARVAIAGSSNGLDWSAWETYVTGAYKQYLS